MTTIFTIGHSTHNAAEFVALLEQHRVTAVADVRSAPYSRHNPHFDRERLKATLRDADIGYVFLGDTLGARSDDPHDYVDGHVSYLRLAARDSFRAGLDRVTSGAATHRIALMCAEKDPLTCHRTILIARALDERGAEVAHILADGSIETHTAAIERLMTEHGIDGADLFADPVEQRRRAYARQEGRIAYRRPSEAEAA